MPFIDVLAMAFVAFILIAIMMFAVEGFKVLLSDCWHRWYEWTPADEAGDQLRVCRKCNLTQTRNIKS